MNIPQILLQIEDLLEDCGMDEDCAECLHSLELQVRSVHDPDAHHELFQSAETGVCECELESLVGRLPEKDARGGNPRVRLEALIKELDTVAHSQLN